MSIRPLIVAALLLALAACDSAGDVTTEEAVPETLAIGGTYSGLTDVVKGDGFRLETEMRVTVPEGTESGNTFALTVIVETARIANNGRSVSGSFVGGTGTYDHPEITLAVDDETIEGKVSDDRDTIRIDNGEGDVVVLIRD